MVQNNKKSIRKYWVTRLFNHSHRLLVCLPHCLICSLRCTHSQARREVNDRMAIFNVFLVWTIVTWWQQLQHRKRKADALVEADKAGQKRRSGQKKLMMSLLVREMWRAAQKNESTFLSVPHMIHITTRS